MSHNDEHDGACCEACAADPVLSVQGCAPCAAAMVSGLTDEQTVELAAVAGLGFGNTETLDGDIVGGRIIPPRGPMPSFESGLQKAGQAISQALNVAEPLLRTNPYTSWIADVNDAATAATQPAAPPPPPPPAPAPNPNAGKFLNFTRFQFGNQANRAALLAPMLTPAVMRETTFNRIKHNVTQAAAGVEVSKAWLRELRDKAKRGDVNARREWAAALALAPTGRR